MMNFLLCHLGKLFPVTLGAWTKCFQRVWKYIFQVLDFIFVINTNHRYDSQPTNSLLGGMWLAIWTPLMQGVNK